MASNQFVNGTVAFSNLVTQDEWQGQPTGYSITLVLDPESAAALESQGVKIKDYEGKAQRKFKSKFEVNQYNEDNTVVAEEDRIEVPYGSKVRVLFSLGPKHPQHGVSPYLNGVKVLELADNEGGAGGGAIPEEF